MSSGAQDTIGRQGSGAEAGQPAAENLQSGVNRVSPGMVDHMAGEAKDFRELLVPYLPTDLVGGSVPYVAGTEDEAVWNAASEACGTEKIHFCYAVEGDRIWYLACPSASLSAEPSSWCPLSAALPGHSEYWDKETVYLYEHEGVASALRWDPETDRMQVFLGASRTILPRIQSMDANFVTVNPDVAEPVPWQSRNLKTEKLARATARMLVITGMVVSAVFVSILAFNFAAVNMIQRDLEVVKQRTEELSVDLMVDANNAMQSDTIKHMVRIQELFDDMIAVDGSLRRYEVKNGRAEWELLVPNAVADRYNRSGDAVKEKGSYWRVKGRD